MVETIKLLCQRLSVQDNYLVAENTISEQKAEILDFKNFNKNLNDRLTILLKEQQLSKEDAKVKFFVGIQQLSKYQLINFFQSTSDISFDRTREEYLNYKRNITEIMKRS